MIPTNNLEIPSSSLICNIKKRTSQYIKKQYQYHNIISNNKQNIKTEHHQPSKFLSLEAGPNNSCSFKISINKNNRIYNGVQNSE